MKTIEIILTLFLFLFFPLVITAQPNPPSEHNQNTNQKSDGGGAPLGSGVLILSGFVLAYATKKAYDLKNKSETQNKDL